MEICLDSQLLRAEWLGGERRRGSAVTAGTDTALQELWMNGNMIGCLAQAIGEKKVVDWVSELNTAANGTYKTQLLRKSWFCLILCNYLVTSTYWQKDKWSLFIVFVSAKKNKSVHLCNACTFLCALTIWFVRNALCLLVSSLESGNTQHYVD